MRSLNFMSLLMIPLIISFGLSACSDRLFVQWSPQYKKSIMEHGECIYIEGYSPRLLIVFHLIANSSIEIGDSEKNASYPSMMKKQNVAPALYFERYGHAIITASTRTTIELTALCLPDACNSSVWYSNDASKALDFTSELAPYSTICAFMSLGPSTKYELNHNLTNSGDSIAFKLNNIDQWTMQDTSDSFTSDSGSFIIRVGSISAARFLNITTSRKNSTESNIAGSGFAAPYNGSISQKSSIMLFSGIIIAVIACSASLFLCSVKSKKGMYVPLKVES